MEAVFRGVLDFLAELDWWWWMVAPLLAWRLRIVTRLAIRQYHRHARRPQTISLEELPPNWEGRLGVTADAGFHPEGELLAQVAREIVRRQIQALPKEFRAVMQLFCLAGLAYEEISNRLRIPIGTVRSRIFRGRRLLRAAFRHEFTRIPVLPAPRHP